SEVGGVTPNRRLRHQRQGQPGDDRGGGGAEPAVGGVAHDGDLVGGHRVGQLEADVNLAVGGHQGGVPVDGLGEVGAEVGGVALRAGVGVLADDEGRRRLGGGEPAPLAGLVPPPAPAQL